MINSDPSEENSSVKTAEKMAREAVRQATVKEKRMQSKKNSNKDYVKKKKMMFKNKKKLTNS